MATIESPIAESKTADVNVTLWMIAIDACVQIPKLIPLMLVIYIPILLGLVGLVGAYLVADIPLRIFFIDPIAEFNSPMYIGLVSNIGVILWGAAASTCVFAGWLTSGSPDCRQRSRFLMLFGLFTAVLMLDDLFLLHEEVIEDHLYINQKYVFAAYGVVLLSLLYRFRMLIFRSDYALLLIAFAFFATSVGVDLFVHPEEFTIFGGFPGRHIIEDGAKLLGIATWAVYLIRTAAQQVTPFVQGD